MQARCGRRHVLEIAEYAAGVEQSVDLGVECTLALVNKVMNREAGNDRIELAQGG